MIPNMLDTDLDAEGRRLLDEVGVRLAGHRREAREAEARREARRVRALRHDAERLVPSAMVAYIDALAAQHGTRVLWLSHLRSGYGRVMLANGHRTIHLPPPRTALDLAAACHEIGHFAAGIDCPGTLPHCEIPSGHDRTMAFCVECETLAWRAAEQWVTFTAEMRAYMRRCLETYIKAGGHHVPTASILAARAASGTVAQAQARLQRLLKETP